MFTNEIVGCRGDETRAVINAVCPIATNQIGYLVGNDLVMISDSIDSKGTFYQPTCAFSPKMALEDADDSTHKPLINQKFALSAATYHAKKMIAVAIDGHIWTSQIHPQTSSQVRLNSNDLSNLTWCASSLARKLSLLS